MGNTQRRLNIALAVDAVGMDAGIKEGLARVRQFAAETKRIDADIAARQQKVAVYARDAMANPSDTGKRMVAQRAVEELNEKIQKGQVSSSLAMMEQEVAKKNAIAQGELKTRVTLDDAYFRNTHTQLQVQLRDRAMYYAKLREMHAGNSTILSKIDRTQVAETARMQEMSGGTAAGGMGEFGKKRLLKQELKYGAAHIAGMEGGPAGMLIASMMYGSAGMAAGIAVMAAGVGIYKSIKEQAKEVASIETDRVALNKRINEMLAVEVSQTGRGGRYAGAAKEARKAADEDRKKVREAYAAEGFWDIAGEMAKRVYGLPADQVRKMRLADSAAADARAFQLEREALKEAEIMRSRSAAADSAGVEGARIAAMVDGPEKRRVELIHRQNLERVKAAQDYENTRRDPARDPVGAAKDAADYAAKMAKMANRFRYEDRLRDRQAADEKLNDQRSAEDARINRTMEGFERERAMMVLRYQREFDDRKKAGKAIADLERRAADDLAALDERNAREKEARAAQVNRAMYDQSRFITFQIENVRGAFDALGGAALARRQMELANPEASKDRIANLVDVQRQLEVAQRSRQMITAAHPLAQYAEFKRQIDENIARGEMGKGEGQAQLKAKLKSIIGHDSAGQFMDAESYSRNIQSALLQDADTPKATLDEIKGLRAELEKLNAKGLKLAG